MATEQQFVYTNTFAGGINSDATVERLPNNQYRCSMNTRIVNSKSSTDPVGNELKNGSIVPIAKPLLFSFDYYIANDYDGQTLKNHGKIYFTQMFASTSFGKYGIVVGILCKSDSLLQPTDENCWSVCRLSVNANNGDNVVQLTELFRSHRKVKEFNDAGITKFSVTINAEIKGVTNLYIANGIDPIIQLNVDPEADDNKQVGVHEEYYFSSNTYMPVNIVQIVKKMSGQLKAGQVQYTYRLYNKNGNFSRPAPLTNLLHVINSSRNKVEGNVAGTKTSVGFMLQIQIKEDCPFDHMQVFRVHETTVNTDPEVSLIHDVAVKNGSLVKLLDTGVQDLQRYTIDEFAALYGQQIIPGSITSNQNRLFAANIIDNTVLRIPESEFDAKAYQYNSYNKIRLYKDSIYTQGKEFTNASTVSPEYYLNRYVDMQTEVFDISETDRCKYAKREGNTMLYGGTGVNVSWKFVTTLINIDTNALALGVIDNVPIQYDATFKYDKLHYITKDGTLVDATTTTDKYVQSCGIYDNFKSNYNDSYTSSLFRNLKRDEVFRYGIVLYDKYGNKSNALWVGDIRTPTDREFPITTTTVDAEQGTVSLHARPLGIEFNVTIPEEVKRKYNVVGYTIVRCAKTPEFSRSLLQVALSRPVRQGKYGPTNERYRTPYYPTMHLTSQFLYTGPLVYGHNTDGTTHWATNLSGDLWGGYDYGDNSATNVENNSLYQIYCPEITLFADDSANVIRTEGSKLTPLRFVYDSDVMLYNTKYEAGTATPFSYLDAGEHRTSIVKSGSNFLYPVMPYESSACHNAGVFALQHGFIDIQSSTKPDRSYVHKLYMNTHGPYTRYAVQSVNNIKVSPAEMTAVDINNVAIPTVANWNDGFTNLQFSGSDIISGIKKYKNYKTPIGKFIFNNWVSTGLYDLRVSHVETQPMENGNNFTCQFTYGNHPDAISENRRRRAYIGPHGQSLLITTTPKNSMLHALETNLRPYNFNGDGTLGSIVCDINHPCQQFAGLSKEEHQYDTYYAFGGFTTLAEQHVGSQILYIGTTITFSGEHYIQPCEFVTMFKAYDFNSISDSIPSAQIVYYVPMESKVNQCFQYGHSYSNTADTNLQNLPGSIDGVTSQDKPYAQYNPIYSQNNKSYDIYEANLIDTPRVQFINRVMYSELKVAGENIDNYCYFKPANFIDGEGEFGPITHIMNDKSQIYVWHETGFGKIGVNERSLVSDNNGNNIQLGSGGVMDRIDYIDTTHGMRAHDRTVHIEGGAVYWFDYIHRALMTSNGTVSTNYGESLQIQSLINSLIFDKSEQMCYYDNQNNELLFTLSTHTQLVINPRYNLASSIYFRPYIGCCYIDNKLFSIDASLTSISQLNNIDEDEYDPEAFTLFFCVNPDPSVVKVFDTQQLIPAKPVLTTPSVKIMSDVSMFFSTDLVTGANSSKLEFTNREGNLSYTIPRTSNKNVKYGRRVRGKYLTQIIQQAESSAFFGISQVLTKFRQSFS